MSEYLRGTRTVVIVGAGFSGSTLAINLLRQLHARPLRIVLITCCAPGASPHES